MKEPAMQQLNTTQSSELSLVERIENVYTALELLVKDEGPHLTERGKATLRKAQSQAQRIRLSLLDSKVDTPSPPATFERSAIFEKLRNEQQAILTESHRLLGKVQKQIRQTHEIIEHCYAFNERQHRYLTR